MKAKKDQIVDPRSRRRVGTNALAPFRDVSPGRHGELGHLTGFKGGFARQVFTRRASSGRYKRLRMVSRVRIVPARYLLVFVVVTLPLHVRADALDGPTVGKRKESEKKDV